jgi:hypothetical protein
VLVLYWYFDVGLYGIVSTGTSKSWWCMNLSKEVSKPTRFATTFPWRILTYTSWHTHLPSLDIIDIGWLCLYPFLDNMEAIQSRQMEPNSDVGLQQPRQSNWERFILGLTMQKLQVYNHYRIVYIIIVHMSSLPLNMKPKKRWFRRGCNRIFQTIQCFFSLGHGININCTYQSSLYACIHNYTYVNVNMSIY